MRFSKVVLSLLSAVLASACVTPVEETAGAAEVAQDALNAPLVGAGTGDSADRWCQVVLRDMGRVVSSNGYAVNGSRWVFEGRVDVSRAALAEGASVRLLVKAGSDPQWRALEPVASTGVDARFERFLFHVEDGNLPGPGMSGTGLSRSTVEVIPFLALGTARVFDHNRIADATLAYRMVLENAWSVAENHEVCGGPQGPTLSFHADFAETQTGPVVAGRSVTLDYDIARNSSCRAGYAGRPAWSVFAVATFLPMNVQQQVSVVDLASGQPRSALAQLHAPEGAQELVVYFQNNDRAGCNAYDSDFGRNYRFPVVAAPSTRGPTWMGNASATLSRASSARCEGSQTIGTEVVFGTWARQRAAITDLCFEAYEPGVTDFDNAELWRQLDVQVHHRLDPAQPFSTSYVNLAGRTGNNARYALDLRAFDPFQWGRCLAGVPTTRVQNPAGDLLLATLEVFFTVNGREFRPEGGGAFRVVFEDYADAPRVTCNP